MIQKQQDYLKKNDQNKYYPTSQTRQWPYIVQLSFILYDTDKNRIVANHDHIIKVKKSVKISEESIKVHGITQNITNSKGIQMKTAIDIFNVYLKEADMIIAHNISFDISMLTVESIRNEKQINFDSIAQYCTMRRGIRICKLVRISRDGNEYYKFPKLIELHKQLFNKEPKNLHNAFIDILICLRCYCMMEYKRDVLSDCRRVKLWLRDCF